MSHVIMIHFVYMNTLKCLVKRKRHLFGAEKLKLFLLLSGIYISGKCY